MFKEILTPEIDTVIKGIIEKDPSTMPTMIARKLKIPEAAVVTALPEEMRTFVSKDKFEEIWAEMTTWEKTTFIAQSSGAIVEVKGKLPKGKNGHGFFNLMEKGNPLGGHLMVDKLEYIAFLEKPFFGLESLSVQFFDKSGDIMFSVYAGREGKELIPEVKKGFFSLKEKMS